MVKIAATEERSFTVQAPLGEVRDFFCNPVLLRDITADVESFEHVEPRRARWILVEKVEKGVRFRADYTVEYDTPGPDQVVWRSVAGNMDVDGEVKLREIDSEHTEIHYRETIAPDLPITRITAVLFKPIVARELRQDISGFIERVAARWGQSTE